MFELTGKYASAKVYANIVEQEAISQIQGMLNHPMFDDATVRIMPDVHSGKGSVIGFTAVVPKQMVIPNIVGVDIGCGVLTTIFTLSPYTAENLDYKVLDDWIRKYVPSGMSVNSRKSKYLTPMMEYLIEGVCNSIEEPKDKIERHKLSFCSLGGGNHYIELGRINFNTFALSVHTGSRNLGVKVCKYYQDKGKTENEYIRANLTERHKWCKTPEEHQRINDEIAKLPKISKELAYCSGKLFEAYINDMILMKRFAAENRKAITSTILECPVFQTAVLNKQFDTIHNYIDFTDNSHKAIIIRKGAISARAGEPLAIPLNMRDGVVIGTGKGNIDWNCSAPHGAGRLMSRSAAKQNLNVADFEKQMQGINTWSVNQSTLDESPMAYKPMSEILSVIGETINVESIIKPIYNFKAGD